MFTSFNENDFWKAIQEKDYTSLKINTVSSMLNDPTFARGETEKVLAILDGDKATFGAPVVEGASVDASVVKNGKGKKIMVFKYKPKKGYRKRQGHRQPYTKVQIGAIKA